MNSSTSALLDTAAKAKPATTDTPAEPDSAAGAVRPRRRASVQPSGAAEPAAAPSAERARAVPRTAAPTPAVPRKPRSSKRAKAANAAPSAEAAVAGRSVEAVKAQKPVKATKPAKPPKAVKADKSDKSDKASKLSKRPQPLVRDSFTMPADDFALVGTLKARALAAKHVAKKSELLRAGLHALQTMSEDQLMATLRALQPIKLGRPKK